MTIIDPAQHDAKNIYKLMVGSIVPRPIAFVSTISADGILNLAPFSFFTGVSANPPVICFCPMVRGSDGKCHLFYSRWPRALGHNAAFFAELMKSLPAAVRRFFLVVAQIHAIGNYSLVIIVASGMAVGVPLWCSTMKLYCQLPANKSSVRPHLEPKRFPRPTGNSYSAKMLTWWGRSKAASTRASVVYCSSR